MTQTIFTAEAVARGGREGEVVSSDGILDLLLVMPPELGGPGGDGTNPEQLFAAGYAACFHSAVRFVAGRDTVDVTGSSVTAQVSLVRTGEEFGLAVALVGRFPALDPGQAQAVMESAHQVCPYSRATLGNVDVTLATLA